jgi:hypothetical protein
MKVPPVDSKHGGVVGHRQVFGHSGASGKGPAKTSNVGKHSATKGEWK